MKRLLVLLFTAFTVSAYAQDTEKQPGIKFSGYVKNDFFYDTRQVETAREGHFLLWPSPELPDENGDDINAVPNFNFLAIQSMITGTITGPDAFGATTSGVIEADFFATTNVTINLLRMRHAYLKMKWSKAELLLGQFWNPLFVTDCYPGTVSFNTGTPLQSFARNPQVRFSYYLGGLSLMAAALSQRDYSSYGPAGTGSTYLRNSGIPDMHLQVQYKMKMKNESSSAVFGGGVAYKTIVPRLSSVMGTTPAQMSYKVDEKVSGLTAITYGKIILKPVTLKLEARYGENISDVLSINGFAVKEIANTTTGECTYTPVKNGTIWTEITTNGNLQFGIFGGITKNLGTRESMSSAGNKVYELAQNLNALYRISPRMIYNTGKIRIALELEYTHAAYGSNYDVNYIPGNTVPVSNLRVLLGTYYFF